MNDEDHDRLVRSEMAIARLQSDAASEKATRSRSNERLHADIERFRNEAFEAREDLKVLLDAKIDAVRKEKTSWFERVFWIFAGAVVSAVVSITISRMGE